MCEVIKAHVETMQNLPVLKNSSDKKMKPEIEIPKQT